MTWFGISELALFTDFQIISFGFGERALLRGDRVHLCGAGACSVADPKSSSD
jgi:hypothetical protein